MTGIQKDVNQKEAKQNVRATRKNRGYTCCGWIPLSSITSVFCVFYGFVRASCRLQPCLLNAAEQEAHMVGGVEQHHAPGAFVIFQHIDAGVILFDLPEMFHA